jgi:hypothetical protein
MELSPSLVAVTPLAPTAGGVLEARRGDEPRGGRGSAMDPPC